MGTPAVTVLMPVFNAEAYLAEAVESILAQTFTDFEFLIIDDGSSDKTPDILEDYARKDARIRLLGNEQNMKIAASLNKGLSLAAAPLIARMDADDISLPDRLEKQVAFMREHPDIIVCSGGLSTFGAQDEICLPLAAEHEAICVKLLFVNSINHPVTMYRRDQICAYAGGYDSSMPPAEDYDLWARLSKNPAVRFANIQDHLYRWRIYPKNNEYYEQQQHKSNLVRKKLLYNIGLTPSEEEFSAHLNLSFFYTEKILSLPEMWACKKWLIKLYKAAINSETKYEPNALTIELKNRWKAFCEINSGMSIWSMIYFCSEFSEFSMKLLLKFVKLALINKLCRLFIRLKNDGFIKTTKYIFLQRKACDK